MSTTTHTRGTHIDAPVEKVFEYVEDPHHFIELFTERDRRHMGMGEVTMTPERVGSTYRMMGRVFLLFHMEWTLTREEYVRNERITDRSNTGGSWTIAVAPAEPSGTDVTMSFSWSQPLVSGIVDRLSWDGDRDLDAMLANLKKAVET